MKYLLDTHVFLWIVTGDERLSQTLVDALSNPTHELYLSAASCWEVAIKYKLGKIHLPKKPSTLLPKLMSDANIDPLPIQLHHSLAIAELPDIHKDPFDRMLIAQAKEEKMKLVTQDKEIKKYPCNCYWI